MAFLLMYNIYIRRLTTVPSKQMWISNENIKFNNKEIKQTKTNILNYIFEKITTQN